MTSRAGATTRMRQLHVFFTFAGLDLALLGILIACLVWRS